MTTEDAPKNPKRVAAGKRNRRLRQPITPSGRRKLREAALEHKPWEKSTGPQSSSGKGRSSQNAAVERSHEEGLALATYSIAKAVYAALKERR